MPPRGVEAGVEYWLLPLSYIADDERATGSQSMYVELSKEDRGPAMVEEQREIDLRPCGGPYPLSAEAAGSSPPLTMPAPPAPVPGALGVALQLLAGDGGAPVRLAEPRSNCFTLTVKMACEREEWALVLVLATARRFRPNASQLLSSPTVCTSCSHTPTCRDETKPRLQVKLIWEPGGQEAAATGFKVEH